MADRAATLKDQPGAELIQSRRAYSLFGTLVNYAPVLRGIATLTLHGSWAVGAVRVPPQLAAPRDSCAAVLELADAAVADNFVQVLGLAINTSEHVAPGVAFLLAGIDSFAFGAGACAAGAEARWTVVSHYTPDADKNPKNISGDVYVLADGGDVVATVLGCRFAQVKLSSLGRVLDAAAGSTKTTAEAPVFALQAPAPAAPVLQTPISPPPTPPAEEKAGDPLPVVEEPSSGAKDQDIAQRVREVVAKYTGAAAADMPSDGTMTEMGIDSLAIVQFADEMGILFGKQFKSDDLTDITLQALISACGQAN